MINLYTETTAQLIAIFAIVSFFALAFYAINSALNHLNHRMDEIERVLHKNRKHK